MQNIKLQVVIILRIKFDATVIYLNLFKVDRSLYHL
jgi:hypothetical protein